MTGATVLVVDDDPAIVRMIGRSLRARGYRVEDAASGAEFASAFARSHPDVVLLDLLLPDADGIDIVARLRSHSDVPIIVLSALGDEPRKVRALDLGADDYLTKPFGMDELLARIRVALRRASDHPASTILRAGSLALDLETRVLHVGNLPVRVTPREFEVLRALMEHPGRILTHRQLLARAWGAEYVDDNHVLRTLVHQLRTKLNAAAPGSGQHLVNEPGIGYRIAHGSDAAPT